MKKIWMWALVAALLLAGLPLAAQIVGGTVRGKVIGDNGLPVPDVDIEWVSTETGRKYNMKTDKKGEYVSVGVTPGVYSVTFSKDGQAIWKVQHRVLLGENALDFDVRAERKRAQEQLSEEQKKQLAAAEKERVTVKELNDMLAQAVDAQKAGDYATAIATLTRAASVDATRDLIWARLADAHLAAGTALEKSGNRSEAAPHWSEAAQAFQKAIDLKKAAAGLVPSPAHAEELAAYYNNLGQAHGKSGKADEAVASYNTAAQVHPAGARMYYFNAGAVYTNVGRVDEAVAAFDKAIGVDPNYAEAYYWKGVNLIGKAEEKGGKMVAPPGTAEALNKYIELKPDGPLAEPAKELLASIGAEVTKGYSARPRRR